MLFFWDSLDELAGEPTPAHKETGETPTYMMVYIDGGLVKVSRPGGAGPGKGHMRPAEGWDVLRDVYVPHDGQPHRIEGEYRCGSPGTLGRRFLISAAFTIAPDGEEESGATSPAELRAPSDPTVLITGRAMDHAEVMAARYHSMAEGSMVRQDEAHQAQLARQEASHQAQFALVQANNQLIVALMKETTGQVQGMAQKALDVAERVAAGQAKAAPAAPPAPGLVEQIQGVIATVAPLAVGGWNLLGGMEGIKAKVAAIAGVGGGGTNIAEIALKAVDRIAETVETIAMSKQVDKHRAIEGPEAEAPAEAAA